MGLAVFKTPRFGGSHRTQQLGNVQTSTALGQQGAVVMSHFVVVSRVNIRQNHRRIL